MSCMLESGGFFMFVGFSGIIKPKWENQFSFLGKSLEFLFVGNWFFLEIGKEIFC